MNASSVYTGSSKNKSNFPRKLRLTIQEFINAKQKSQLRNMGRIGTVIRVTKMMGQLDSTFYLALHLLLSTTLQKSFKNSLIGSPNERRTWKNRKC